MVIGPLELLIIGFVCLFSIGLPVVVVLVVLKLTSKGSGSAETSMPACDACGAPLSAPGAVCPRCAEKE